MEDSTQEVEVKEQHKCQLDIVLTGGAGAKAVCNLEISQLMAKFNEAYVHNQLLILENVMDGDPSADAAIKMQHLIIDPNNVMYMIVTELNLGGRVQLVKPTLIMPGNLQKQ